jgi:hypothetical protein
MPVRMKQEKNNRVIDLNEKVCIIADYVGDYTGSGAQMFRPWQSDDLLAALSIGRFTCRLVKGFLG